MKLTLAEPKYLKESISIISELVNEARLKITPNAIELVAMDPANVAMVVFKLLSSAFVEYDIKAPVEIAINLNNLKAVLRRARPNDMLSLELADNKLKIKFKSNTTRTFSLPIIEIDEKEQKVPDLVFPISIMTNSSILTDSIDDADIVGESVTFIAEPKKFTVLAEGDLNKAQIEINADDDTEIQAEQTVKAKYSVEYLKKMVQGGKLADKVMVQFNKDYPLKLSYVSVDRVSMSFILAPRVEND
jgi:proliferating cell nuclear antigen